MKLKRWQLILLIVLAAVLVTAGIMHRTVWTVWSNLTQKTIQLPEDGEWTGGTTERIRYGDQEAQYIDLYVPNGTDMAPLFVLVHGGGFVSGDSQTRQAQFMIRYFREHGFACASVNYRLAQEARFPAAVEDVREAVRFLAGHAEDYGYSSDRIAIWGESAGGYLAAYEAVTEEAAEISALVDFYGVMDFPSMESQFREQGIPSWVISTANSWMGSIGSEFKSYEEYWIGAEKGAWDEELKQRISVLRVAEKADGSRNLKVMIQHGDADLTVPYAQSEALAEVLEQVYGKEKVSFQLMHGLKHASDLFYTEDNLAQVEQFLRQALE